MIPLLLRTSRLRFVLAFSAGLTVASAAPLRLPGEFPVAMTFRAADTLHGEAFAKRLEEYAPYPVIHAPGNAENSRATSMRWPDKIVTDQMAYGGVGGDVAPKVWPGHFLYKVGTKLEKDLQPGDTVLHVENFRQLAREGTDTSEAKFPVTFTIYALDGKGLPDWSHAEHVTLLKVANGELVVKRGEWGSTPLAFKAGQAVVSGHMMFWTRQFQLNLSLHCPRGGPGNLTAAEWFAREVAARNQETGADGVEFDVGRWTWGYPKSNAMDCNNDLLPDYGYISGVNSFGLGGRVLFRELRRILGPNKIIQVDSNDPIYGVRGWDDLNGVQLECFPAGNRFDKFSTAFLHLRKWVESAGASPRYSYGFTKAPTTVFSGSREPDGASMDFHFRVGLAADCLVGMPHPFASIGDMAFDPANENGKEETKEVFGLFDWDEYHGGDLNDWNWLGKPFSPARQYLDDLGAKDLLEGVEWNWQVDSGFEAATGQAGGAFRAVVNRIPEQTLPYDLWFGVRLEPVAGQAPPLKPDQEYTLVFDACGDDAWQFGGKVFPRVPRMIAIRGFEESRGKADVSSSVLAEAKWQTYRISLTTSSTPGSDLAFGVSEQIGRTEIRNIRLYEGGAERWARDFQNGKVLLNMTNHPWRLNIGSGYRRLKGTQCPEVNNGERISGMIEVPARDAIFLVRGQK